MVFFCCKYLSAQQDSLTTLSHFQNWVPPLLNINDSVQYDHNTQTIFITNYVGGHSLTTPVYFSFQEYRDYLFNQKLNQYWKDRISGNVKSNEMGKVSGDQLINRIFGGSFVDIKPQGSTELIFSGVINKIDNPALPEQQRKTTSFNFDERIQMNVVGRIGDKLQLQANYDTEATFEFENEIKLEYTGQEDDIVKKIELGNVSLPLSGSLIQGAQSLFGIKTKFQFGKTTLTTVFSEQKSETSSIEVQGGAQMTEFELSIDEYESNKHFFLSQYFYENFNQAMSNLPIITSPINITKLEVYVTNKNATTINTRNILAFQDLGELQNISSPLVTTESLVMVPSNSNNSLNPNGSFITDVFDLTGDSIRLIDEITSAFSQYTSDGINYFNQAVDYEKIENARRLSNSEYSFHPQLGFISLNQALNSDEILAVAFQFTYLGVPYQVGEFSTDVTAPNTLILKLLKSTTTDVNEPNWNLLMKNVYSLGAYQINQQDFVLDILYENPELGAPVNFLTEGPEGVVNTPLLQVFNVDNLNSNNDPGSDGVFDFLDGTLINSSNGRVYFPMLEPFGNFLRDQFADEQEIANNYCFDALYDSTQAAAQQLADLNKFLLRGQYKSSIGSEISLNAMNIPEGSVKVNSGGRTLEENIHYTVDYTMGRVRIIDEGVLMSSEPIRITLENNSLFNFQSKRFMGAHLDYRVNKDFILGFTTLNLTEKPLTQKINIGDEPISNTIIGLNSSYSKDSRFLTKLIDKLPFLETKEVSNIAVNSEFAYFLPGHPKSINIDDTGTSYIDDFENSQSSIDIRSVSAWSLSSTPTGSSSSTTGVLDFDGYFPEAFLSNNIEYGYNRAKLAWYVIDPLFQRNSAITPSHIANDPTQQTNNYVREVLITEIFPNKDVVNGQPQRLRTLDFAFYPEERGPYNFDLMGVPGISYGINEDGFLNNPTTRWGGVTRKIETNDFEAANIEFIEFWMLDPFLDNPNHNGGDFFINLGNVSEDILKDSRKSFENGLSIDGSDNNIDTTVWGRVPSIQSLVNAFDNDEGARENQDLGYDGLSDNAERTFLYDEADITNSTFLDDVAMNFGENSVVYQKVYEDPAADNFKYFRSSNFDNAETSILERYKNFNGVEGNSPTSEQSTEDYPTSSTNLPDVEDINNDQTLSEVESYYQYKISLHPDQLEIGTNYINDIIENVGPNNDARWIQFKIPIQSYDKKIGTIQDFKSIRFIRTFFHGFQENIVCRFATFELVRGEWRRYLNDLTNSELNSDDVQTQFDISVVNFEENGSRYPIPYVLPPGIQRETYYGATSLQQQNEQSMVLKVLDLEDGDARAAFKNVTMDMRNYKNIEMYSHVESIEENSLEDDSLNLFIRIGTDYTSNYYEYQIPLKITNWGATEANEIWPIENRINLPLELLQTVKQLRNDSMRIDNNFTYMDTYQYNEGNKIVSVTGNPNLGNVKTIMIGVKNPGDGSGPSKSAEIWVNELRLSEFNEKGGWSTRTQIRLRLADFANIGFAGSMSTVGYGSLDQNISERNLNELKRYNLTASLELGQLFPEKSNIKLPMYVSISESVENPQYNPLDPDILLDASLEAYETNIEKDSIRNIVQDYTRIKSINFTNVRKERATGKTKSKIYDIENFTLSYSYNEVFSRNINTEYSIRQDYTGGLGYNFNTNPKNIKPFSKFKFLKKGRYLRLLKDFNIYFLPKQFSFRTDFNRSYLETKMRNTATPDIDLPEMYSKLFTMSRIYNMKYDLTRSVKVNFSARNQSIVDEPYGRINTKEERDSLFSNIISLGRPTEYHHNFDIRYNLPISKIPILSWINTSINYDASYDWRTSSLASESFGNTIQNNNSIKLNTQFNLTSLYNKVPFLKKLLATTQPNNRSRVGVRDRALSVSKDIDDKETPSKDFKLLKYVVKTLFSVKNFSISYTESNGTLLPGFLPQADFFGLYSPFTNSAPTLGFVLGSQNDIRYLAANNGWLTTNPELNNLYTQTFSNNLNIRATVEPISRFKIMFTGSRRYSINENEYFRNSPDATLDNPVFEHVSNSKTGNFNISFLPIKTSFIKDRVDNSSELFENFLNFRFDIAQRLANNAGLPNSDSTYPDGFGPSSQDVMIPAFLAAYSGVNPNRQSLNKFPSIPMPNWNVNFNGFTKIPWVKSTFKNVSLSHSYRSTYSVGSFTSNLLFQDEIYDSNNNFLTEFQIDQINITEQFAPFLKLDLTLKNSMTTRFEYKKDRTISLSLSNSQITEVKGFEYVVGLGYRIQGVQLIFDGGSGQKKVSSDLDLRADISIRNNKTIIRRIEEESNQPTSGQSLITLKFSADYVVNNRINLKLFYDQVVTDYVVSSSFPTSNTNVGVSLRFTLM